MTRQAAVEAADGAIHVERRCRRPRADHRLDAGDPERIARVDLAVHHAGERTDRAAVGERLARVLDHLDLARQWREALAGQRHDRGDRRAGHQFTIGQGARALGGRAVRQGVGPLVDAFAVAGAGLQRRAGLEGVVDAPEVPHALREVGIEVAVEDRVAGTLVAIARAAEGDFVGVARAGADRLRVDVVGVVVVRVEQPLVVVQVEDVLFLAGVQVAELDEVTEVAVVHVRRVVRVVHPRGLGAEQRHVADLAAAFVDIGLHVFGRDANEVRPRHLAGCQLLQAEVGRRVDQQGRVTDGERRQEELLERAVDTVVHRPDAEPVGHHLGAHPGRAVIDHEGVAHAMQRVAEYRVLEHAGEGLRRRVLVVEDRGELAERLEPVRQRGVGLAGRLERVGAARERPVLLGADDHRVDVAMHEAPHTRLGLQHVEDRPAGLALGHPGGRGGVDGLVVDHRVAGAGGAGERGVDIAALDLGRLPGEHRVAELARRQAQFLFGHLAAVEPGLRRLHRDHAEQAGAAGAGGAFATERRARVRDEKGAFLVRGRAKPVDAGLPGRGQRAEIRAGIRRIGGDRADEFEPVRVETGDAAGDLVVDVHVRIARTLVHRVAGGQQRRLVGLERVRDAGQQVGEADLEAITGGHAQDQRARPQVRAQRHVAEQAARRGEFGGRQRPRRLAGAA